MVIALSLPSLHLSVFLPLRMAEVSQEERLQAIAVRSFAHAHTHTPLVTLKATERQIIAACQTLTTCPIDSTFSIPSPSPIREH